MTVDPNLFDHVKLVESRLADEGIEFASRKDLIDVSECFKPELFNFFSVHGKTVFLKKYYRSFSLVCRHFNPASEFGLTCISHSFANDEFTVRRYTDFSLAMRDFLFVVQGLCKFAHEQALRSFSRG